MDEEKRIEEIANWWERITETERMVVIERAYKEYHKGSR
mgnify:CR=1 FL=1